MKISYTAESFIKKAARDKRVLPSHISLYMAMYYYSPGYTNNEFFRISRKNLMLCSRIKSVATYHKCIRELTEFGYIVYRPSFDPYRASMVSFIV